MILNPVQPKPFSVSFELKPQYLQAKVKGKSATLEISRSYWAEIVKEAQLVNPKNLLVWEDFPEALNTQDTFALVSELCQLTQFLHLKIAFLDEHLDQLDRNKLGGLIASNRGFTCRVFTQFSEAEKWLLQEATVKLPANP